MHNYVGIGKTTLANEICKRWAEEMFLLENFSIIILIALRTVQQRSLEDVMKTLIGAEAYQELIETLGEECLIILEGLDEVACEWQQSDALFAALMDFTVLEKAIILITSRPHACQRLNAHRMIEIVGFGEEQIQKFVIQSFSDDPDNENAVIFVQQLKLHPQIYSLCYVPVSLVIIIDIFKYNKNSLPLTLTKLYQTFTDMMLVRDKNRKGVALPSTAIITENTKQLLCKALQDVPSESIGKLFLLSKLAYHGFFEKNALQGVLSELIDKLVLLSKLAYQSFLKKNIRIGGVKHHNERKVCNPKLIFNESDLKQYNIEIAYIKGLLKVVTIHYLTGDYVTYNFIHLTVQEYLCAVYMLTLSQEEQYHLLNECFDDYPNIMILYCGLTKLEIGEIVHSKLTSYNSAVTAIKCLYESQQNTTLCESSPFVLNISYIYLMPYDCYCLSYVYYHYPVTHLKMYMCNIGDKNAKLLAKWCSDKKKVLNLQQLDLAENNLTSEGMKHVIDIVKC